MIWLIIVSFIVLFWGGSAYAWPNPNYGRPLGGAFFVFGLIWLVVLILMVIGQVGPVSTSPVIR
jgi:hypothetical protein